jgi:hypothetical protein
MPYKIGIEYLNSQVRIGWSISILGNGNATLNPVRMNRTANDLSNLNSFFVADVFAEVDISYSDLKSRNKQQKQ